MRAANNCELRIFPGFAIIGTQKIITTGTTCTGCAAIAIIGNAISLFSLKRKHFTTHLKPVPRYIGSIYFRRARRQKRYKGCGGRCIPNCLLYPGNAVAKQAMAKHFSFFYTYLQCLGGPVLDRAHTIEKWYACTHEMIIVYGK